MTTTTPPDGPDFTLMDDGLWLLHKRPDGSWFTAHEVFLRPTTRAAMRADEAYLTGAHLSFKEEDR